MEIRYSNTDVLWAHVSFTIILSVYSLLNSYQNELVNKTSTSEETNVEFVKRIDSLATTSKRKADEKNRMNSTGF